MSKIFKSLFVAGVALFSFCFNAISQTDGTTDQRVELFDFSESLFPNGADAKRLEWEKEFIEFGKKTELTPQNYIRHIFKWFRFEPEEQYLDAYLFDYVYGSARYEYDSFKDSEYDGWGEKNAVREGYLFFHISRDGENVKRLWDIFDELVLSITSRYMQKGRLERAYVEILAATWECISAKKNYAKKLDKIYVQLVEKGTYAMETHAKSIQCASVDNQLNNPKDVYLGYNKSWFYSFWVRRHHEGNAAETYEILTALLK